MITADLRARCGYLGYCPLCSHIGVMDFPDMLIGPSHREVHLRAIGSMAVRITQKLRWCCSLSESTEQFDSPAEAAAHWREKRQQPLKDPSAESRRLLNLARFAQRGLEPITTETP